MTTNSQRIFVRSAMSVVISTMTLLAVYRVALLLLGAMIYGIKPISIFDVADLLGGPVYLLSAILAFRWPWIAELVSILTLAVIFARFHPWEMSPFQRGLTTDYEFIVLANVVFFANVFLRRDEAKRKQQAAIPALPSLL
jgi:hypothetical protein